MAAPKNKKTEPKKEQPAPQRLDPSQAAAAAQAGLAIINHEQGVIPNRVRNLVPGLERMLAGIAQGKLAVFQVPTPEQPDVPELPEEK